MISMGLDWHVSGGSAVVLLSGGQDSAYALSWAVQTWGRDRVHALSVDYGQRHARELRAAVEIAKLLRVSHRVASLRLDLASSLTDGGGDSVVVPMRNAILLDMAAGYAASIGADVVAIGACEADAEAFPDCRPDFLSAWERAARLALGRVIYICAPLLGMSKAATVRKMRADAKAWEALALSWSCYGGGDAPCGECRACVARAAGFAEAGETDPALEAP